MEPAAATSVPCIFTTQEPGSQVVVAQVQLPQDQLQTSSSAAATFQASTPAQAAVLGHVQDGVSGSLPVVQQAMYQTEGSNNVAGQSLQGQGQFQGQLPTSYFSTTSIEGMVESASSASVSPSSYDDVVKKLNELFSNEMTQIHSITDDHWKVQEFPLARIKKIMRMDEDVRMISAEVPVMLSKALEMFITELSLRAWLQTEASKRRTVQRSDIAMAITKNDMFDFLIDIVPREEIQLRTKSQKGTEGGGGVGGGEGGGDSLQLLPPELLQMCIQQLAQQAITTSAEGGLAEDDSSITGGDSSDSSATLGLLQQQLQLLQQLMQIQQLQQEQQLEQTSSAPDQTVQLQRPPVLDQTQSNNNSAETPTLDTEVLYSSVSGISTPSTGVAASSVATGRGSAEGIQFSTALEQLTSTGNHQTILSIQPDQHNNNASSSVGVSFTDGSQQTLRVDPNSVAFHHQPHELLQEPNSHSTTIIIHQPSMMDEAVTTSNQSGTMVTTLLDSASQEQFHTHQLQHMNLDQSQQQHIQIVTSNGQTVGNLQHQMVHHVLVDPASVDHATSGHFQISGVNEGGGGDSGNGGVASSVMQSSDTLLEGLPSTSVTYTTQ